MARYEHLPIYKQAMDVAVHFEKVVALIMKANATRDKHPHLLHLRKCLDE